MARQHTRVERRRVTACAGSGHEDVARCREVRVDPLQHGHRIDLAPVIDHELTRAARILVRVRGVFRAEMQITRAIGHEHHRVFGERIVGMGEIEDAAPGRRGYIGGRFERRLTIGHRSRITASAVHAHTTALEKHQQPIQAGASDEEAVVRVERAAGLAARRQCVPTVLQFREHGKLCGRRLRCCQASARNKDQQQQCSASDGLLLARVHGSVLRLRGRIITLLRHADSTVDDRRAIRGTPRSSPRSREARRSVSSGRTMRRCRW